MPGMSLLELMPDLARDLSDEQRAAAQEFLLPVEAVDKDADVAALLAQSAAFGAMVLDGMLIQALQVGRDWTLRLIGPGSFVPATPAPRAMPILVARLLAPTRTRIVLFGEELTIAVRHWPEIVSGLFERMLEQSQELATQLAVCQLPRVEDRLMALMWLLAESWGKLTPAGVSLQLSLSHEVLGGLVGARRPTVTLALNQLAERGSLIRSGDTWLILERPPVPPRTTGKVPGLLLTAPANSSWTSPNQDGRVSGELEVLLQSVARMCERSAQEIRRARELQDQAKQLLELSSLRGNGPNNRAR